MDPLENPAKVRSHLHIIRLRTFKFNSIVLFQSEEGEDTGTSVDAIVDGTPVDQESDQCSDNGTFHEG